MAMRSVATLAVQFGLVSVPVKLYPATTENKESRFNLCDKDGGKLTQQYVNAAGTVITRDQMLKGYEVEPGKYVTFTPDELKSMEAEGSAVAEISEFVPASAIDPLYFEKPYFMAPDKTSAKPYALLVAALRETGRVALARWANRGKSKVVAIRATDDGLVLEQLNLFSHVVRSQKDLAIPAADLKESEVKLAMQLVEAQAAEAFDPTQYEDVVGKRIQDAITKKVEGQEFKIIAEQSGETAQVIDLATALQASIDKKLAAKGKPATKAEPAADVAPAAKKPSRKKAA